MYNFIIPLYNFFSVYFVAVYTPTARNLFLFLLAMLALESARSIRFLYRHFLSKITDKSLNTFYYACSCANIDYSRFMNITARTALKYIWQKGSYSIRDSPEKRFWQPTPVFQHSFAKTASNLLCMAGKISVKPDGEQPFIM